MIWATVILILVFTTSVYAAYAFDMRIRTTRSINDIESYDETNHYHTTRVALQGDSGINRIKDNIEVNRTEITNTPILPEFIASSINGNLTAGDDNRVRPIPESILIDNQSGIIAYALPSFLEDLSKSCVGNFACKASLSTGWQDNTSLQISTTNNTKKTWSSIYGKEIGVNPKEGYELVTHMKLNDVATSSHIGIEGFNETSNNWKQIKQCPSGIDGPLEWHQFRCVIEIPENTTKIRPILNAGWSSVAKEEATTWFDSLYMIKINGPFIFNPNLRAQVVVQGLTFPVDMAFLGPDDILVVEKNNGTVQRIINGTKLPEPLIDLNVARKWARGLLGISIEKSSGLNQSGVNMESTHVYLYLTESKSSDGEDLNKNIEPRNRLYRYELVDNKLVNQKLLLDLLAGEYHNGGKILTGPDNYIYIGIGEKETANLSHVRNKALNYEGKNADDPDGRGGILRIDQNGQSIGTHGILGDEEPLKKYYAYGIRNSFGMDFDPLTGKLWDTENGLNWGDEINLVEPGFNSGWNKVQGIWKYHSSKDPFNASEITYNPSDLVDFGGKGKYNSPEFTWNDTIGPTALKFLSTDKLGKEYENDMFTADTNNGRIYHFKLNQNRTGLLLEGPLFDKVAYNDDELKNLIFAGGFGLITDLEIGPDGYLYVVAFNDGKIYRIVPNHPKEHAEPLVGFGLPFWIDHLMSCEKSFKCASASSTGWKDKTSLQISTTNNTKNTWSWIYGQANPVKPGEKYELLTHMKLNDLARESHVVLEGFNEGSKKWYEIEQCPVGTNGPLEWKEFDCTITIPENSTKIRPVLNAGWSSQENATAITLFDAIHLYRIR
jgi:aldose sugar dehydrogenase